MSELGTITYPTPTGESLNYGYDPAGIPTSATYAGPVDTGDADTYTPNPDGQVGSSSQLGGFSSSNTFNAYSQVTGATNPGNSSPDTYGDQPNGEITSDQAPGLSAVTSHYNAGS